MDWSESNHKPGRFVLAPSDHHLSESEEEHEIEWRRGEAGYQRIGSPLCSSSPSEQVGTDALEVERENLIRDLQRLFAEILDDETAQVLTVTDLNIRSIFSRL